MKFLISVSLTIISSVNILLAVEYSDVKVAAGLTAEYLSVLENKKVAVVANQSSMIENTHLVDSLVSLNIDIVKVFSPEHGFRGDADAGEHVGSYTDTRTGLPVVSLYGSHKKPTTEDLKDIDIVIFDLQDVGVRFYTYISTMHYLMEACAENALEFLVLDRPNPNGFYVDGPVLDLQYKSFIGMHPVPLVHGMTVGEYAMMINGEWWLSDSLKCNLTVIPCQGWDHTKFYKLPVKPSPNLPNMLSVYLYPSLGLFEGTVISVGRGTDFPFQVFGHPDMKDGNFSFTPRSIEGASKDPKLKAENCIGWDLRKKGEEWVVTQKSLQLQWLVYSFNSSIDKENFFKPFIYKLCGNEDIKEMIEKGSDVAEIRAAWKEDVENFKQTRSKYLLYRDFE